MNEVKAHVPADRLLVWEVKEGWAPLCKEEHIKCFLSFTLSPPPMLWWSWSMPFLPFLFQSMGIFGHEFVVNVKILIEKPHAPTPLSNLKNPFLMCLALVS